MLRFGMIKNSRDQTTKVINDVCDSGHVTMSICVLLLHVVVLFLIHFSLQVKAVDNEFSFPLYLHFHSTSTSASTST